MYVCIYIYIYIHTYTYIYSHLTFTRRQMRPDHHECKERWDMTAEQCARTSRIFAIVDGCFTAFFLGELLVNLAGHWFKAFFKDAWNVFDLVVVAVSLMSYGEASLSHVKTLRLLRVFLHTRMCLCIVLNGCMYMQIGTCAYVNICLYVCL